MTTAGDHATAFMVLAQHIVLCNLHDTIAIGVSYGGTILFGTLRVPFNNLVVVVVVGAG